MSIAGDVNGDGFDDVVVGARLGDAANNAKANAGDSYIVLGGNSFFILRHPHRNRELRNANRKQLDQPDGRWTRQ